MDCLDVVLYQEIQARLTSLPSQPTPFGPTSIRQQRYTHTHTHTHTHPITISPYHLLFLPSLPPAEAVMTTLGRKEFLSVDQL